MVKSYGVWTHRRSAPPPKSLKWLDASERWVHPWKLSKALWPTRCRLTQKIIKVIAYFSTFYYVTLESFFPKKLINTWWSWANLMVFVDDFWKLIFLLFRGNTLNFVAQSHPALLRQIFIPDLLQSYSLIPEMRHKINLPCFRAWFRKSTPNH